MKFKIGDRVKFVNNKHLLKANNGIWRFSGSVGGKKLGDIVKIASIHDPLYCIEGSDNYWNLEPYWELVKIERRKCEL